MFMAHQWNTSEREADLQPADKKMQGHWQKESIMEYSNTD